MPASSRNYIYKVSYTIYCICSLYTPTTCKPRAKTGAMGCGPAVRHLCPAVAGGCLHA
jgi:hypothetical protein